MRRLLEPIEGAISRLSEEAICDQVGFVPALFALEGIALLQPSVRVFTPMVRASLLSKSEAYEEIGPAIEYLSRRV